MAAAPPGIGNRVQRTSSLEPGEIRDQELAAPDGAVGAVTGAVECHADDRAGFAVVGQAGAMCA